MYTYLKLLFNICLFKKGPQDIPYSALLFRLSIIGFAIFNYLLMQLSVDGLQALLQLGVELVIVIGFSGLVLSMSHKLSRFLQTACALIGTDALLSFFAMPVLATISLDNNNVLAFFVMLGLIVWNWLVTTHIIRHAINKSFSFAAGIVFLYIFSAYKIMAILFPAVSPPT
ncbi:MAG: hypothetical protein KAJ63_16425 [Methyloprofundus sp.]|nr:hypothetical protein [Methyloprofundus sp.]